MTILAIEFSSTRRSVALVVNGEVRGRAQEASPGENRALGLIEAALHDAGMERENVDCLAVGLGPGSYTGIRSAIALAQGWQLARETKALGISSVEAIAAQARAERIHGNVNILIDAQRNEFYLARYAVSADGYQEVAPLRLASWQEVLTVARAGETVLSPDVISGVYDGPGFHPHAAWVGQLAARRSDFVPCQRLEPIYLRQTCFAKAPPARVIPSV